MTKGQSGGTMPRRRLKTSSPRVRTTSASRRVRTSSQSSVEIQVSDHETVSIITTTSAGGQLRVPARMTHGTTTHSSMVLPKQQFLQLLKSVGAEGDQTGLGELFTVSQICHYLKEYIKTRDLYDHMDPLTVYCSRDPLGGVFGVEKFTLQEALGLVKKNTVIVEPSAMRAPRGHHSTPPPTHQEAAPNNLQASHQEAAPSQVQASHQGLTPTNLLATPMEIDSINKEQKENSNEVSSTTITPQNRVPQNGHPVKRPRCYESETEDENDDNSLKRQRLSPTNKGRKHLFLDENGNKELEDKQDLGQVKGEDKQDLGQEDLGRVKGEDLCSSSKSAEQEPIPGPSHKQDAEPNNAQDAESCKRKKRRKRTKSERPAASTGSPDSRRRGSSFSFYYGSDGEKASTSQPWYLEVELHDSDETVYSVQSKETVYVKDSSDDLWFLDEEDEISIEFQTSQSAIFAEEYEVESEASSHHGDDVTDDSDSPDEEIIVVCDESDVQFWADSESSDDEDCTDDELTKADKWICEHCSFVNSPKRRHCAKCWKVRSGWLPEQKLCSPRANNIRNSYPQSDWLTRQRNRSAYFQDDSSDFKRPFIHSSPSSGAKLRAGDSKLMDKFLNSQAHGLPKMECDLVSHNPMESPQSHNAPLPCLPSHTSVNLPEFIRKKSCIESVNSRLARAESQPTCTVTSQTGMTPDSMKADLSRADTLPIHEFKVPSSCPDEVSSCQAKGSHLPRLHLPSDDSGFGSITSSQESSHSASWLPTQDPLKSPLARPASSPRRTFFPSRLPDSPSLNAISPSRRKSPYCGSPFSARQNLFPFDPLVSPKRPAKPASKQVFFMEPIPPSPKKKAPNGTEYSDVCMICLSKPKEASIIHGKTGHQVCCYICAKQLRRRGKPCPVCRRPIQKVIKNYFV